MIYCIGDPEGDEVKIGYSINPTKRLSQIQCSHSRQMEILGVIPGGRDQEAHLHAQLAELRLEGEWFEMHPAITEIFNIQPAKAICIYESPLNRLLKLDGATVKLYYWMLFRGDSHGHYAPTPLQRKDFADAVGGSPSTVPNAIKKLMNAGLITRAERGYYKVLNQHLLPPTDEPAPYAGPKR